MPSDHACSQLYSLLLHQLTMGSPHVRLIANRKVNLALRGLLPAVVSRALQKPHQHYVTNTLILVISKEIYYP